VAAAACVADDSTIRRWKSGFAETLPDITQRLASIHAKTTNETVPIGTTSRILDDIRKNHKRWLSFVMALLINSGHKLLTRFAFCPRPSGDKVSVRTKNRKDGHENYDKTIKDSS
jgi:hypothetical protein